MIKKPEVTEEQKEKFTTEYMAILEQAPENVRQGGEIIQFDLIGTPFFLKGTPQKLSGALADKYVTLMNRLNSRTL